MAQRDVDWGSACDTGEDPDVVVDPDLRTVSSLFVGAKVVVDGEFLHGDGGAVAVAYSNHH